ncbi:DUF1493 family protein [Siccibacter turicensis]|uniref:DUF1493 domain-containing protein n=1 Tax=Siccibacter turicensis TaxID=357233 RepID=A0A2P8VQD4_9ENTR|nr:DUF1493 family protein [Siccibacter turicensis]PSN09620.1 hypothetical protein C7G83_02425 [Siccibacter turicensis]
MASSNTRDITVSCIKSELPLVTSLLRKIDIEQDATLQDYFEADDIASMSEKFFAAFSVNSARFALDNYYPWNSPSLLSPSPRNPDKKPLTLSMYLASARAGEWLFY